MEAMPEFMGYDRAIVTFSPDGRLFQVEYAREAVKRGTTSLGLVFNGGVVFAAMRPLAGMMLPSVGSGQNHEGDTNLGIAAAGFLADGRVLMDISRMKAQVYRLTFDEQLNVTGAVREISDRMQVYTQFGGVRPFGVALLLGGVDEKGAQLFEIDPSSAFYSWQAQAIRRGSAEALKVLRKGWSEKISEEDAVKLAVSALRAGEKGVKAEEIELAVVNGSGFKKYSGPDGMKFIKKYF